MNYNINEPAEGFGSSDEDLKFDKAVDELVEMKVIDFEQVFGLSLDRDTNNRSNFEKVATNKKKKFFRAYMPIELEWGD